MIADILRRSVIGRALLMFSNPDSVELTDIQTKFTLSWLPRMASDFSSLKFSTLSGVSCPHWVESYTEEDEAEVWVRIPSVNSSGVSLVMSYIESEDFSNPDDVFYFYDDFTTADKWTSNSQYLYIDTTNHLLKCTTYNDYSGKIVIDDTLNLEDYLMEYDAASDGAYHNTEFLFVALSSSLTPSYASTGTIFGGYFYGGSSADHDASWQFNYYYSSSLVKVGKFYHGHWTRYNYQHKRVGSKFSYSVTVDSTGDPVVSGSDLDCDTTTMQKLFLAMRDSRGGIVTDIYAPLIIRSPNTNLTLESVSVI